MARTVAWVVTANGPGITNEVIPPGGEADTITYHEFRGPFTVTIVAVDLAGTASAPSNAITVSTQGGGCF